MAFVVLGLFACQEDSINAPAIPDEVITKIENMGFNPDGIEAIEEGYLIERDIIITNDILKNAPTEYQVPNAEQYHTTNLVTTNGSRTIAIYAKDKGKSGFSPGILAALDLAIERFNAENLEISFTRTTKKGKADIIMKKFSKRDGPGGFLASAGFPTANGDPYHEIKISGLLESTFSNDTEVLASIIAHEIGHCIGFRHTDYFDRSISCGGSPLNEGAGAEGVVHIPGTPTGATLDARSWMLSCIDTSNRPFNNDDKTALDYLY